MRVVTGSARGRLLETLPGEDTRPTAAHVKEALFSAIQFDIEGRRVLDLFAGCGQLGIEALSRGAASCVLVDRNSQATELIRRNLNATDLSAAAQVLTLDYSAAVAGLREPVDLVFLDPPYAAGLLEPALRLCEPHVAKGGLVVAESDRHLELPETVGHLTLCKTYRYGRILLWLYRYAEETETL